MWVAIRALPPAAQWARTASAKSATLARSSETVGSSRIQTGRPVTNSRAKPSRRFCPADRFWASRLRRPTRSKARSASSIGGPPKIADQNSRFSTTVICAFSPSAWAA